MSKALILVRNAAHRGLDAVQTVLVLGCALALILAGDALPF